MDWLSGYRIFPVVDGEEVEKEGEMERYLWRDAELLGLEKLMKELQGRRDRRQRKEMANGRGVPVSRNSAWFLSFAIDWSNASLISRRCVLGVLECGEATHKRSTLYIRLLG
jgi:hypothetical protein